MSSFEPDPHLASARPPAEHRLWARPGDRLVIRGHSLGQPNRDAEVLEPLGYANGPPFRVRWQDDGHVSEIFPGADAYVEHLAPAEPGEESVAG